MAETISVSIPDDEKDLLEWVEREVDKKRFSNKSHAIRYALHKTRESEKNNVIA